MKVEVKSWISIFFTDNLPQPDVNNKTIIIDTTPEMGPAFKWGDLHGAIFTKNVENASEKNVCWERSLFLLPTGNASKNCIQGCS